MDLLQVLRMNRRSGLLELELEGRRGTLFLSEGEVIDAEVGRFRAEKAFYRTLEWEGGKFEFRPQPVGVRQLIRRPGENLILEGLRQLDEVRQAARHARPAGDAPRAGAPLRGAAGAPAAGDARGAQAPRVLHEPRRRPQPERPARPRTVHDPPRAGGAADRRRGRRGRGARRGGRGAAAALARGRAQAQLRAGRRARGGPALLERQGAAGRGDRPAAAPLPRGALAPQGVPHRRLDRLRAGGRRAVRAGRDPPGARGDGARALRHPRDGGLPPALGGARRAARSAGSPSPPPTRPCRRSRRRATPSCGCRSSSPAPGCGCPRTARRRRRRRRRSAGGWPATRRGTRRGTSPPSAPSSR